jgi:hypothetical protein
MSENNCMAFAGMFCVSQARVFGIRVGGEAYVEDRR